MTTGNKGMQKLEHKQILATAQARGSKGLLIHTNQTNPNPNPIKIFAADEARRANGIVPPVHRRHRGRTSGLASGAAKAFDVSHMFDINNQQPTINNQ